MSEARARKILTVACVMALVALGLIVWSVLAPSVASVMVAMSMAQGIGTLSFLLYLWTVIADLRRRKVFDATGEPPPPEKGSE